MTNVVALRPAQGPHDELAEGLVSLAVGLRLAAGHVRSLDLAAAQRYDALVALIEAARQINRAALILEGAGRCEAGR